MATEKDQPPRMISYWIEKHGVVAAIEAYYPALAKRPDVAAAIVQVKSGLAYMEKVAAEHEATDPERD